MSYTQRQTKLGRYTFTLVNEEDKWHRIVSFGKEADGDIVQTIEYHGPRGWTLETVVKGARGSSWTLTGRTRLTASEVQEIAREWRKPF